MDLAVQILNLVTAVIRLMEAAARGMSEARRLRQKLKGRKH